MINAAGVSELRVISVSGGEPGRGDVLLRKSLVQEERWRMEPEKTQLKEELKKSHLQRR